MVTVATADQVTLAELLERDDLQPVPARDAAPQLTAGLEPLRLFAPAASAARRAARPDHRPAALTRVAATAELRARPLRVRRPATAHDRQEAAMLQLTIHHPDAIGDPYPLDHPGALADAIGQEAEIVASDAGSDLLESPAQHHRDMLRDQVIGAATRALRATGDSYTDPAGIRWTLEDAR